MSRQRLESRLMRLASRQATIVGGDVLARLARQYDLEESEIVAEEERLMRRFHELDAMTDEQRIQVVADDLGILASELRRRVTMLLASPQ